MKDYNKKRGEFDFQYPVKLYRNNREKIFVFYQKGVAVEKVISEFRLYRCAFKHDSKGKPFIEGNLQDCHKTYQRDYILNGVRYDAYDANLYQSLRPDDFESAGTEVRFDPKKRIWIDKYEKQVTHCAMIYLDEEYNEVTQTWDDRILAY